MNRERRGGFRPQEESEEPTDFTRALLTDPDLASRLGEAIRQVRAEQNETDEEKTPEQEGGE